MTADLLATLFVFAFVTSITPGPNNLMLLASGVNFGFRRTVPHVLGISFGFALMLVLIGLGLGKVFETYPPLYTVLEAVGAIYMLYLAWKIATSGPVGEGTSRGSPMNFAQAAAFQWVNPKAWVVSVAANTTYALPHDAWWPPLVLAAVYTVVGTPSVAVWLLFGTGLKALLTRPAILKGFNIAMAALLVLSLWPMLTQH